MPRTTDTRELKMRIGTSYFVINPEYCTITEGWRVPREERTHQDGDDLDVSRATRKPREVRFGGRVRRELGRECLTALQGVVYTRDNQGVPRLIDLQWQGVAFRGVVLSVQVHEEGYYQYTYSCEMVEYVPARRARTLSELSAVRCYEWTAPFDTDAQTLADMFVVDVLDLVDVNEWVDVFHVGKDTVVKVPQKGPLA